MIVDSYSLIEYDDFWRVPLTGRTVSRFLIDNALCVEFIDADREYVMITIEQEFHLEMNGISHVLSPKIPTQCGPVFFLRHSTVKNALAFKDGTLKLEFSNSAKLAIKAHPQFEAWSVAGDHGLRVICLPGGELAVWQPELALQ